MSQCLPPDILRQILDGGLPEQALQIAQSHVDSCQRCLAVLEQMSEDTELRSWIRIKPIDKMEPALNHLMQGLLDTSHSTTTFHGSPRNHEASISEAAGAETGEVFVFAGYEVRRELGRGGMGIVLLANDKTLNRDVALKVLRRERNADVACRQRFLNEARAAASVNHDHVVNLHAVVAPADSPPYLVMEYVAGPTLRQRIEESGPLAPREAAEACAQVALGLEAAHAVGLIHRDIKPSNILLDHATGRAKIMDFGLSRSVDAAGLTLEGELLGTPAYMSPEQIRQPDAIDVRSDVYSLGATLYEALTGTEPFRGTTHGVLLQVLHEEPRRPRLLNEAVPLDLETICLHALAKEPARRYGSAAAMADDLGRWLRAEPIQARPIGAAERSWRWAQRNPRVAALSSLVALLLVLASVGSISFASRLAKEKSETVAALVEAESNANSARKAEAEAVANADEARDLGTAALDAHSALIFKVQEQLGNRAGTLPLRKQLLETALEGLQKIVTRAHGPDSERSVQAAYDRMSDVFSSLGRTEEAKKSSATACNLAEKRAAHLPDDTQAQSDLALAHDKLGSFSYVEHNLVEALAQFEKAQAIREALVAKNPKPEVARGLAVSFNKIADVYFFTDRVSQAADYYTRGLALTEGLAAAEPANTTYKRDLRFSYARLAMLHEGRRDFVQAAAFQKKALQSAEELAALDPANTQWQRDFGFSAGMAGTLDLKLDQVSAALGHFRTYLAVSEKLLAADPENALWGRDVGLASQRLAEALLRSGYRVAAHASAQRALVVFERLMKKDPDNVALHVDYILVSLGLANLDERQGQYRLAAEWSGRSVQSLEALRGAGKLQGPILSALMVQAHTLDACYRVAAKTPHFENVARPSNANPALLALWSLAQARQGRHAEAALAAEELCKHGPDNATYFAVAARIYAVCAAPVLSGGAPTDRATPVHEKYVDKSIKALAEALRLSPSYEWHLEPDFDPIRATPGYRQLFSGRD